MGRWNPEHVINYQFFAFIQSRNRDHHRQRQSSFVADEPQLHDANQNLSTMRPESSLPPQQTRECSISLSRTMTTVSFENQSFNPDERLEPSAIDIPVPSISMMVFQSEDHVPAEQTDNDNEIVMLHL